MLDVLFANPKSKIENPKWTAAVDSRNDSDYLE
jgi:hypothetical protein